MTDDFAARRAQYLTEVRGLYRWPRWVGLAACIAGAALFVWPHYDPGAPRAAVEAGLGLAAAGWVIFITVIIRRTRWVRAHPFDPKS